MTESNGRNGKNGLRSPKVWVPVVGLVVTLLIYGAYMRYNAFYVSTEDSAVDGNIILISANANGRVMEFPLNQGDPVVKGQEVARIDTTGFQRLRQINESNQSAFKDLQKAISTEESLKVLLLNAESQYRRGIRLRKGGFITAQDLENLRTTVDDDRSQLLQAKRLFCPNG